MGARLSVRSTTSGHRFTVFVDAAPLLLGRARTSDIRLPFAVVSSRHLRLGRDEDGSWTIEELGSTNGTRLNDQPLVPGPPERLSSGDELAIGDVSISFVDDAQQNSGDFTLAQTGTLARKLVAEALSFERDDESAFIEIVAGPATGTRKLIADEIDDLIIGSSSEAWLTLPGIDENHLRIYRSGDGFGLERLSEDVEPRELSSKDRIEVGEHALVFFDPLEALLAENAPGTSTTVDAENSLEPDAEAAAEQSNSSGETKKEGRALGATEMGLIVFVALLFLGGIAVMLVLFDVV